MICDAIIFLPEMPRQEFHADNHEGVREKIRMGSPQYPFYAVSSHPFISPRRRRSLRHTHVCRVPPLCPLICSPRRLRCCRSSPVVGCRAFRRPRLILSQLSSCLSLHSTSHDWDTTCLQDGQTLPYLRPHRFELHGRTDRKLAYFLCEVVRELARRRGRPHGYGRHSPTASYMLLLVDESRIMIKIITSGARLRNTG